MFKNCGKSVSQFNSRVGESVKFCVLGISYLFELLTKKSLNVTKNKNKAELIKIVLTRKLIPRFLTIKADNENEIIKNIIK